MDPGRRRFAFCASEQGFALVAVLFVVAIIAAMTVGLLLLAQQAARESADIATDVENHAAGEAGLNRIILAYLRPGDPLREQLVGDGRPVVWDFTGTKITLRVQAESGKLDLNAGNRDHIAALVQRLMPEPEAQSRFLSGLDSARSRNQLIASPSALLSPFDRMTMRHDLMNAHFTVLTGQRGFDPRTAPEAVIETAPGLPDEAKQEIFDARANGRLFNPAGFALVPAQMFVGEKPLYTLRAETSAGFARPGAMAAQVEFSERGRVFIFSWQTVSPRPGG